jgi:ABC-2 type transport system permease protein
MPTLLTLLRKDFQNFIRDKAAVSLTFIVPVALIYIFGHVFGLNRKETGPSGIRLAVVAEAPSTAAEKLTAALKAEKAFRVQTHRTMPDRTEAVLTEADVRRAMLDGQLRFAVVIPAALLREDAIGIRLRILSNPQNEIETQTVHGLLQKTIFASVPELLGQSLQAQAGRYLGAARLERFNQSLATSIASAFDTDTATIKRSIEAGKFGLGGFSNSNPATPGAASGGGLGDIVKIETETVVGAQVKSPAATRLVGGWAIMFLLFALSGAATAFFDEKKTGIFQRLLAAPVSRAQILWSRFTWGVLLGLVQLTTLFLAGRALYGIDVFGNFPNLIIVCIAAAAACTAFGMLLVSIASTPAAASGLATFLVLMMSACGGAWFPLSLMPPFMQELAKFTLVYWALEGFSQVLWAGHSLVQLLPTLGVLLGITIVVMAVAIWRFNRGRLFE